MLYRTVITLLITSSVQASTLFIPDSDSLALAHIGMNTLNSLRELNEIVTESREFGENFEMVHSKVETGIWKAERTSMWLEDVKELKTSDIENIDDFNYVLSRIKDQTAYLRRKLVEQYNKNQESKEKLSSSQREERRSEKRFLMYSSEAKASMTPQRAQVETAKNTKDLVIENARLNTKIDKLSVEMSKLTILMQEREERRLKRELRERSDMNRLDKGVLTQREVSRK